MLRRLLIIHLLLTLAIWVLPIPGKSMVSGICFNGSMKAMGAEKAKVHRIGALLPGVRGRGSAGYPAVGHGLSPSPAVRLHSGNYIYQFTPAAAPGLARPTVD
ncbi:hypothetical protein GC174_08820 [bacterium]|nr:hypothetical protein [bacterium]